VHKSKLRQDVEFREKRRSIYGKKRRQGKEVRYERMMISVIGDRCNFRFYEVAFSFPDLKITQTG